MLSNRLNYHQKYFIIQVLLRNLIHRKTTTRYSIFKILPLTQTSRKLTIKWLKNTILIMILQWNWCSSQLKRLMRFYLIRAWEKNMIASETMKWDQIGPTKINSHITMKIVDTENSGNSIIKIQCSNRVKIENLTQIPTDRIPLENNN